MDKKEMLTNVFCNVLETQAFMFAEPVEEFPMTPKDFVVTHIGFKGVKNGRIEMVVPASMTVEIAESILGMEIEDDEAIDAIKELLNIICGNLVTKLYGESALISPTIPEIDDVSSEGWEEYLSDNALLFAVDDKPIILRVFESEANIEH